ncbi:ribosome rescue GTPase HflX [Pseudomonas sp. F1_0610]|uniref:ribosome rescue GTPase HflX n=1 Tax=Pseudomonas sp. F1_0610 TaxID=3114284 RepID=UPI0039C45217
MDHQSAHAERVILVHLEGNDPQLREDPHEFLELVTSAGAQVARFVTVSRHQPTARFLIGSGKVDELRFLVQELEVDLVIFNHALTPSQERNLSRELECRVIDRVGLILDIFAQRANTHEGKLQVELAQLEHISSRLVHSRTYLSRQQGGIGLRGPGETQLESDRRLLRIRVQQIKARLEKVRNQRELARRARKRAEIPAVSIVGYTNAGKSTLFNSLTQEEVYAADQLFATLDPTVRRYHLPDVGPITLTDTVGFIRHLPHKLVEAFRATLEESANADLLLHVIDAASLERDEHIVQVHTVLDEIGAKDIPTLEIYNKIDLLSDVPAHIQRDADGKPVRVWVSAMHNQGLILIAQAMSELLGEEIYTGTLCLPQKLGRVRGKLFALGAVQQEQFSESGESILTLRMPKIDLNRLLSHEQFEIETFLQTYAIK